MDQRKGLQTVTTLLLAAVLAGCGRGVDAPPASVAALDAAPPPAAGEVAKVEGIEWFEGGIDAALAAAAQQGKLVFLYWGAEWCPPCHDLKAHVFPRSDFQQALRQFVPVYLDGDAPRAQQVAERFGVRGYPSVVVLKADGTELARISGGSDLASYADVLQLALEGAQPVQSVLASLRQDTARRLDAAECRRLAWNDWSDSSALEDEIAPALQLAAARCPQQSRVERDRLLVQAADFAALAADEEDADKAPDAALSGLIDSVRELLSDRQRSLDAGTALLYLGEEFFAAARRASPAAAAQLQERYFAFLDGLEHDARQSDTVRLLTAARRLQAARVLGGEGAVPDDIARRARATLDEFLARDYDANARAGIVNSASWVLSELGDDARLRELLEAQMKVSRTPYYYMPDVADIEERAGNSKAAIGWLERGYRESRGPATRFQWGTLYLQGLLRMSPGDAPRIQAATIEVLGELAGPDLIHARNRARLERLDAALGEWANGNAGNAAAFAAIRQRWRDICARLPADEPARATCPELLG